MVNIYNDARIFSAKLAKQAGKILIENFGRIKFIKSKEQKSYVTNVDLESEKLIISEIKKKFSSHNIISEESGQINNKSGYTWYIDPLDGTHNYINQLPLFGTSIALAHNNNVIAGSIYLPFFNELYTAEKSKGSLLNNKPINVSDKKSLAKSFVIIDLSLRYVPEQKIEILTKLKGKVYDIRVLGSAVIGYAYVAKGISDAYITPYTNSWDVAAGALIVQESNGKVTDFSGKNWSPKQGAFITTNKKLHNKIIGILNN